MAERPLIVTGCQRSGTAYIAAVLTTAGHWCAHERIFRLGNCGTPQPTTIESSHVAAPFVAETDAYVVHQARHPLRVVSSLMANGKFRGKTRPASARWAESVVPEIVVDGDDGITRTVRYVIAWNQLTGSHADQWWRVEDVTADEIFQALTLSGRHPSLDRIKLALAITATDINARPSKVDQLGWSDLPDGEPTDALAAMTSDYGYTEDPNP